MSVDQFDRSAHADRAVAALELEKSATGPAHAVLSLMMEATSPATESEFFRFMVEKIATTLGVHWVFVTECLDYPTISVGMLASWYGGDVGPTVDFSLAGTPCNEVITEGSVCFYPRNIVDFFPKEKRHGQQSYIGVPIFESGGSRVIGHIAIFDKKDMTDGILRDEFLVDTVLRIFAERTGAEIQRMQLTRALRGSAESYRLILDNQNEFVVEVDQGGHLLFVSPSYCKALGRRADELLGASFSMSSQQCRIDMDGKSATGPTITSRLSRFDERLLTTSGWRWISWDSKPIESTEPNTDSHLVFVGRDVTDQKNAEEKVREHFRELAHVARRSSLSEMSSAIAHEINQPLASILTYAQACLRISKAQISDKSAINDALRSIASNAERAGDIIRRLRNFTRNAEPERDELSINRLVRDVVLLMQPEVSRHEIEIELELDEALGVIEVDVIQIQQVIVNLIQNAIDSIKAHPKAVQSIFISTEKCNEGGILIAVRDFGDGVSPQLALSLFDPFITTKEDGLGIGLSISRSIVDAHGGNLSFTPVCPSGAEFRIFLPGGAGRHSCHE